jgi:steroid delta-isomerase-like uncharacterized protein
MSNKNSLKDILTNFIQEVWNDGNIEASDKYISNKYKIFHDPGDPWDKQELDLKSYKERVKLSRAPFPDQCFVIKEIFSEDNTVVITWFWTGTHKGDIQGFQASGKEIKMSGITVYYFEGNRIKGHWQIVDRLGVYQQLQQKPTVQK